MRAVAKSIVKERCYFITVGHIIVMLGILLHSTDTCVLDFIEHDCSVYKSNNDNGFCQG